MTQQPKALWLADLIDNDLKNSAHHEESAAELRRLYQLAEEQHTEIYGLRLKVRNLLKALEWIANRCPEQMLKQPLHTIHQEAVYDAGACARAAIAAAKVEA
jgi:hypothetical protein